MRLKEYAKEMGVHYKTAQKWFKNGDLAGYKTKSGTIIITEDPKKGQVGRVIEEEGDSNV